MKKILAILLVLIVSQICFAQAEAYKFAEYDQNGRGCSGYFRMADFAEKLKQENSNGLIVVYAESKDERFGNVVAYVSGARRYLRDWIGLAPEKVSFIISSGKPQFAEEYWIIPQNAQIPKTPEFEFNWANLNKKYHFSRSCLDCEPSYPLLTNFQPNFAGFANVLKEYPNYKGQIIVNDYWELAQVKSALTNNLKLPRHRYSIQLRKKNKNEEWNGSVDLYLIPNSNTQQNSSAKLN